MARVELSRGLPLLRVIQSRCYIWYNNGALQRRNCCFSSYYYHLSPISLCLMDKTVACWHLGKCQAGQECLNQCFGNPVSPLSPSPAKQSWFLQLWWAGTWGVPGRGLKSCVSIYMPSKRLFIPGSTDSNSSPGTTFLSLMESSDSWSTGYQTEIPLCRRKNRSWKCVRTFLTGNPSRVVFLTHNLGTPTKTMLLKRWISWTTAFV